MPIIGDIAFAMLVGVQRAWVDIDVGVELLNRDAVATCLEELTEGGSYDPLTQGGDYAPRDEDVLCFHYSLNIYRSVKVGRDGVSLPEGKEQMMLNTPPKLHDKDTVFARFIRPKVYPDKPQEKSRRLNGALQWGK